MTLDHKPSNCLITKREKLLENNSHIRVLCIVSPFNVRSFAVHHTTAVVSRIPWESYLDFLDKANSMFMSKDSLAMHVRTF